MSNHTDVVTRTKADLESRGFTLAGPDGAFEITKRVAWTLRDEGAGLLDKPSGNNSHGFAVDQICYQNGEIHDILSDAGGANGPMWGAPEQVAASRYRPAFDPGDVVTPPVEPPVVPPPVDASIQQLVAQIAEMRASLEAQADRNTEKIQSQINQVVQDAENTAKLYLPLLERLKGFFA